MGLITTAMRCNDVGRSQDNIVCAIGAIARRIRGAEESYSGSAKRDREMQRAGIAADDARCVAQKSHEWTEWTIVRQGVGVTAAFADGQGEVIFSGTVVHDTTQGEGVSNPPAELTEALGRPTF